MSDNTSHPSRLALDRYLTGAGDEADRATDEHVRSCPRCAALVKQLRAEDQAFLEQFPTREALAQARPRRARPPLRRKLFRLGLPLAAAMAASVAAVVLWPRAPGQVDDGGGVRVKGGAVVELAVKRGSRSFPYNGQHLRSGDVLAFRYTTRLRYLLLLSLEQSGEVNILLADAAGRRSMGIAPGRKVKLGSGVQLDDAPGAERFIVLLSREPLKAQALRREVSTRFRALTPEDRPGLEIGRLPAGEEQFSWLIRKAAR